MAWKKAEHIDIFTKDRLLNEPWVKYATDVLVYVYDEFENRVCGFEINEERIKEI